MDSKGLAEADFEQGSGRPFTMIDRFSRFGVALPPAGSMSPSPTGRQSETRGTRFRRLERRMADQPMTLRRRIAPAGQRAR